MIDSPETGFEKGIRAGSLVLDSDEEDDIKADTRDGMQGQSGGQVLNSHDGNQEASRLPGNHGSSQNQ